MCTKNYKSRFKFVEVIQEKVLTLFFWTLCINNAIDYNNYYAKCVSVSVVVYTWSLTFTCV